MFIDADVLVAARFMTAPAHVAVCRCLDRMNDALMDAMRLIAQLEPLFLPEPE